MHTKAKEKIRRRQPVIIVNPDHPSPGLVEFIGTLDVDAVFLDCEHGSATTERVEDMVRAAHLAGAAAVVRPPNADPSTIIRYLDLRADGVIVPHVDTAEAARQVVETVRYARIHDHADKIILVQIESAEAIRNLSEIVAVDGVDVFFIGPDDLSRSMGLPGQIGHPEVQAAIDQAIATICAAGKVPGTLATVDTAAEYVRKGVGALYVHANAFLVAGVDRYRTEVIAG